MKKFASALLSLVLIFGIASAASADMGSGSPMEPDPKYLPYTEVGDFSEGMASYFELNTEQDVYGFINAQGKIVIPAKYEAVIGFSEGLAAVKSKGKWGFVDKTGKEVITPKYENTYMFVEGLAPAAKNGKVLYIDKTGKEVIKTQAVNAYSFSNGLAGIQVNGKWGFVDKSGKAVVKPQYDGAFSFNENLAPVKKGGKWGFINKAGKTVLKFQYESTKTFSEGLVGVKNKGKWGFVDKSGKQVVNFKYSEVLNYSEGLAAVQTNGKWGFVDKKGTEVIKPQYVNVQYSFSEGLAAVSLGSLPERTGYIDKKGKVVIPFQDEFSAGPFTKGLALVADGGQGSFYFITNPLTAPAAPKIPAVSEKKMQIKGSAGSYVGVTNVTEQQTSGPVTVLLAKAPVAVTFHGDDLIFENIATIPEYEAYPFTLKKSVQPDDNSILDELLQKPEFSLRNLYVTGNYAELKKAGDYYVAAMPKGKEATGFIIRITDK